MPTPTLELPVQLLEAVASCVPSGLVVLGTDGRTLFANRPAQLLFGRDIVGHTPAEWPGEARSGTGDPLATSWGELPVWDTALGGETAEIEVFARSPDTNAEHHLQVSARPTSVESDAAPLIVVTLQSLEDPVDHETRPGVPAQTELEADLRHAVVDRQIVVQYQPIVELTSSRLAGFEALARWRHPRRGFIPPLEFIPLAEKTELIVPIDRLVLEEAARQSSEWRQRFGHAERLTVNVNFSGRQFSDSRLVNEVQRILESTGVDLSRVKIEITESVIMRNHDTAVALLERLRQLGLGVCIDDFGTGYSSLGYLHVLPVDTLKIDRSFVGGIQGENKNFEIVRTIVSLAQNLDLSVVAEGVETEEQRAVLRSLGCEFAQGYLFSRPLDAAAATELIRAEGVG